MYLLDPFSALAFASARVAVRALNTAASFTSFWVSFHIRLGYKIFFGNNLITYLSFYPLRLSYLLVFRSLFPLMAGWESEMMSMKAFIFFTSRIWICYPLSHGKSRIETYDGWCRWKWMQFIKACCLGTDKQLALVDARLKVLKHS